MINLKKENGNNKKELSLENKIFEVIIFLFLMINSVLGYIMSIAYFNSNENFKMSLTSFLASVISFLEIFAICVTVFLVILTTFILKCKIEKFWKIKIPYYVFALIIIIFLILPLFLNISSLLSKISPLFLI